MHILNTPHTNSDGTINGAVLIKKYKQAREIFSQLYDECINNGIIVGNKFHVKSEHIEECVAEICELEVDQIKRKSRAKHLVEARMIAYHMLYNYAGLTLKQIGNRYNGRDHTTIINGLQNYAKWIFSDPVFAAKAKACEDAILTKPCD